MADWKKGVGWAAVAIGTSLLVLVVTAFFLLRSPGFHTWVLAKIVQQASESTGARVELQNFDFHVKTLTADIYGLTVHGTEAAGERPLLQVQKATVGIKIISILHRRVNLSELVVDAPVVNLTVNKEGRSNLPTPPPSNKKSSTNVFDLAVGHVLLTNGAGTDYGLGVEVDITKGHRRISHGGEAVGYLSENRIYPDDRAAIVVLDNADFGNAQTSIADSIEKILFADAGDVGRAKVVFEDLRAGRIDRARFTANGNHYFTPQAIADYRTSLTALGEPESFVRNRSSLRGGFTAESYTVDYGTKKLTIVLRAEPGPKGRIEQFTVYPAD